MKPETIPTPSLERMIPLLVRMQRDLDQDLNLEALAERFGYSAFHFHRLFRETVGETPRRYVERLRLEKAAYKLQISAESILDISLATGFRNHETFARAFRRHFGGTPNRYRIDGKIAQAKRLERNRNFQGDQCVLSDVTFESLRPRHLLTIRHLGDYQAIPAPFSKKDRLWNKLVRWADAHAVPHTRLAIAFYHDDPTVTPKPAQRCDVTIPIDGKVAGTQRIRCLEFAGGPYGVIEHIGPASTLIQGFRQLADGIRRSKKWGFRDGPAIQIVRNEHVDAESSLNCTDLQLPVKKTQK
jgi:AraC family transcriptional regulator